MSKPQNVSDYIGTFPKDVQLILQSVRNTVQKAAPKTVEAISYGIPVYKLDGKSVVYFAGAKKHVAVYPFSKEMGDAFSEAEQYDQSGKGTIRFPLDAPVPHRLITKIVKHLLHRHKAKQDAALQATKTITAKKPAGQGTVVKNRSLNPDIAAYNEAQQERDREVCSLLAGEITRHLKGAESKVWHAHPVWFLDGNPIVGYSKLKGSVRLMFWSGQSFDEPGLQHEGTFKAAEARYNAASQVNKKDLKRWLAKAIDIQWDYKNIIKRKGKLERLK